MHYRSDLIAHCDNLFGGRHPDLLFSWEILLIFVLVPPHTVSELIKSLLGRHIVIRAATICPHLHREIFWAEGEREELHEFQLRAVSLRLYCERSITKGTEHYTGISLYQFGEPLCNSDGNVRAIWELE